ncbi:MBL fold metallo-hydrolase [Solirubrobacter ginsenosidimutans]|uniref:MBL fold metallo-hydrolase n=1 Tax=Solirubrobacter ginsenosidimutans TaxID=490573 RepID=A0A9X3MQK4_9ACTN|nr:MBL fold metallo-hydrolase [Solirubrobacter ginsenosidimutans]MDA0160046.1 MBL fold metallo-hydrolase [Solirubrobacter ginsenosidimutans]
MIEPRPAGVRVTWVGHATVLVETPGARIITDPVLRHRVAHLLRQVPDPPDPGPVDAVLLSHLHHDHFDKPSLRTVANASTTAILPTGAGHYLDRIPFGRVLELRAGESVTIGDATVRAVPAWHDGRRRPGPGVVEHDTLGYLIGDVWFAGDTDIDDDMAALRGQVDVALIPIWGWGTSLGPGHLDPEGAARAMALVQPRVAVPIHWGTFLPIGLGRRYPGLLVEPPLEFARHMEKHAPSVQVETLAPGDSLLVS